MKLRRKRVEQQEDFKDLGFGQAVANRSDVRLLNRDGSFNVRRTSYSFWRAKSLYHYLLLVSWPKFLGITLAAYLVLNAAFALAFYLCGPDALRGATSNEVLGHFAESFFFSVQTFATVGYGRMTPASFAANVLVTVETLVGLLSLALATGLLFARFSRPTAQIKFTQRAIIAPYRDGTSFQFRIVNERKNQILELEVRIILARTERRDGIGRRKFYELELERKQVVFFPLHWTIVHPITKSSPLYGVDAAELRESDAEFMVLLTGTDDTFSQTVHTWTSYKSEEIVWGARFEDILRAAEEGGIEIDLDRLDDITEVSLETN